MLKVKQLCCAIYLYYAHIDIHPLQAKTIKACEKAIDSGSDVIDCPKYYGNDKTNYKFGSLLRFAILFLKHPLYKNISFETVCETFYSECKFRNINCPLAELIEDIYYVVEPKKYDSDMINIARYIRKEKKFDEIKYLVDACIEHGFDAEATHFSSGIHTYACPLLKDIGTIS